jgi:hypothetical protein
MTRRFAKLWRRSRGWPVAGQIGLAIVMGLVVAVFISAVSNRSGSKLADTSSSSTSATVSVPTSSPPTTTTTATAPVSADAGLVRLTIAEPSHRATYSRTVDFGGWIDVHGCQDTRATLLIRMSQAPVTFTTSSNCTVKTGRWIDPWSGAATTTAHDFQIDHTVPLANAWRSGAWAWTHDRRVAYANDIIDVDHLVPILARENQSKSDGGPDEWKPPNQTAWCRYALVWDRIKAKWHLSATPVEWNALVEMARTC